MLFTNKIIVVYKITLKLMLSYRSLSRRNKIVRTLGLGKEFEFIDVLRRRKKLLYSFWYINLLRWYHCIILMFVAFKVREIFDSYIIWGGKRKSSKKQRYLRIIKFNHFEN
jgi:hypothetical protein